MNPVSVLQQTVTAVVKFVSYGTVYAYINVVHIYIYIYINFRWPFRWRQLSNLRHLS